MTNLAPYDFCLAFNSEHDVSFARLIEKECQRYGLSLLQISASNIAKTTDALLKGELAFRALLDRASDEDRRFMPVAVWAAGHPVFCFNSFQLARQAWDKAHMHEILRGVVNTPFTEIVPPYVAHPGLPHVDFQRLGPRFTVKPAHGGGGLGVVNDVTDFFQIQRARQEWPHDQFLLQRKIVPTLLDGCRLAWFRVIYAAGAVFSCYWDPQTHVYSYLSAEEIGEQLAEIGEAIAESSGLRFFSTEVALTAQGQFIVIDYVNDPLDLRLLSAAPDGIPDDLARLIARSLVEHLVWRLRKRPSWQISAAASAAVCA